MKCGESDMEWGGGGGKELHCGAEVRVPQILLAGCVLLGIQPNCAGPRTPL